MTSATEAVVHNETIHIEVRPDGKARVEQTIIYERNLRFVLLLPFLWTLAILAFFGLELNLLTDCVPEVRSVKRHAREARALKIIYEFKPKALPPLTVHNWKKWIKALLRELYFQLPICQATRNRHKIVYETILQEGQKIIDGLNGKQFRMISVGCGFAEPVLQAVVFWNSGEVNVQLLLIDINQETLNTAKKRAEDLHIGCLVTAKKGRAEDIETLAGYFHAHLLETVGLPEYFPETKTKKTFRAFWQQMEVDGVILTANISHWAIERPFISGVIKWKMLYRTARQLRRLLETAGFQTRVWHEPWRIFNLAVGKRIG